MKMKFLGLALAAASLLFPSTGGAAGPAEHLEKATFAGGCFWCMEEAFDDLPGVVAAVSGYTGGRVPHPSYEQVSSGGTGHAESVEILFDPARISYRKLLDVFWHNVDPTDAGGQFCDRGDQYRSEIFYHGEEQKREAEESKREIEKTKTFPQPIVTKIVPASTFWPAEAYHQHYAKKNPIRYRFYRNGCGRDRRLHELWGTPGR
jgi:peptide-methionine (S)-S-oxide reductase